VSPEIKTNRKVELFPTGTGEAENIYSLQIDPILYSILTVVRCAAPI
jgi:hypothetical protein